VDARTRIWALVAVAAAEAVVLAALTYAGSGYPMAGIVVRRGAALVEADNQSGVMDAIRVVRVVAPSPSWVVVRLDADGAPGMPVGRAHVPAGTTTALEVKLDAMGDLTPVLWVSLFADGGRSDAFEVNMADMSASRDKPWVVDGHEVVARIGVQQAGVAAAKGGAAVSGARLTSPRSVTVASVTAPAASWLVVEVAAASPGAGTVLGIAPVAPGSVTDAVVPLSSLPAGAALTVSLRADAGKLGRFDMADDQTYRIGSGFVTTPVQAR
jgi:hypothetical protein